MNNENFDTPKNYNIEEAFARLLTDKPQQAHTLLEELQAMALSVRGL